MLYKCDECGWTSAIRPEGQTRPDDEFGFGFIPWNDERETYCPECRSVVYKWE